MSFRARVTRLAGVAVLAAVLAPVMGSSGALGNTSSQVVVQRGQPLELAFTAVNTQGEFLAEASQSIENAVRMAIERHATIRGFPVQVNVVETLCGVDNTAAATEIVNNAQNTAVLGHLCSAGFENALEIYDEAGVVTISGSASNSSLPAHGPTVFNRTIVVSDAPGDDGELWGTQVAALPTVLEWAQEYEADFGEAPFLQPLPALYFDAASLLLKRLQQVSRIVDGNLVIDRGKLAQAVRASTKYQGVTCKVTLDPATGNRLNDQAALARCAEG